MYVYNLMNYVRVEIDDVHVQSKNARVKSFDALVTDENSLVTHEFVALRTSRWPVDRS